eukprot:gnl/MRDRNA2_/MRDRNA2_78375_c0_seq2.p1 gnl/MRDRNA2_/MRDRNA2_78375_c0~~gnl/MRDRNA2_/MRDRNA2_78375_c0_seq2.p1  ORF type:complete len:643 (-),score=129.41 gnl/MRDRNA2_/MRDRNA2_78375_c0_seq2:262-2190(-)
MFNEALVQQQLQMQRLLEDLLAPQASQLTRHQQYLEHLLAKSDAIEVAMSSQLRNSAPFPSASPAFDSSYPGLQTSSQKSEVAPQNGEHVEDTITNQTGLDIYEDSGDAGNLGDHVHDGPAHPKNRPAKGVTKFLSGAAAWERHAFEAAQGWMKEKQLESGVDKTFISGDKNKQNEKGKKPCLTSIVQSQTFDHVCAAAIVLNAVVIGWQADQKVRTPWVAENIVFQIFESAFCYFFLAELCLRIVAFRLKFIFSKDWLWNLFDCSVVLVALADELAYRTNSTKQAGTSNMTILRILRILRITRIAKILRMRFFSELRLMVNSTLSCVKSLCWALVLLLLVAYTFGVYFTQLAAEKIKQNGNTAEGHSRSEDLRTYYGGMYTTLISMFKAISGGADWGDIAEPLAELGTGYYLLFCFYIAFVVFAMMNVVTSVFVEQAAKNAWNDKNWVIEEQMSKQESYINDVKKVFEEADEDNSGNLEWTEFEKHMADPRVQAFFQALEIDSAEAKGLFQLIDTDGDNRVQLNEFVNGCLRLKGQARSLDLVTLLHENKKMHLKLRDFMKDCESHFTKIRVRETELKHEFAKVAYVVSRRGQVSANADTVVDPQVAPAISIGHDASSNSIHAVPACPNDAHDVAKGLRWN